ncbi:GIY-YIG nuclease family protein [Desulfosporosinus sp. BG]|uniref:GIY-YIG nuclease family protein n=1 Tax=Desulfosporosinus sp. BG TaxID=1633135 RepID=UPI0008556448|nr:GIY-YIG nuclease family protein [Desulfosporosinus sp. BG]ODA41851.1 methionine sulfoxide reductase A [Desulfosporosinus sp. BG]
MAMRGKSINLFLMDGDPNGRIKCTLANWTGVAYKIPRTELEKCKGRDDLSQSGVYFLFGSSDQTGENTTYIGQAGIRKNGEGILYRLQEHKRNPDKDYWTEAVVFTTSNNSFGPTEISYLENRFANMAVAAKRYLVKNGNEPTPGHITEEKESELEEFVDYAKIIMSTLGHKVFEPLAQIILASSATTPSDERGSLFFSIKRSGANAQARLTSEGLVVMAGSSIRKDSVPSCPDYVKSAREDNKEYIDKNGILQKDILFKTPSGASSFVLGAPTNGNVEWKTEDGKTFKEAEAAETADQ